MHGQSPYTSFILARSQSHGNAFGTELGDPFQYTLRLTPGE